VPRTQGLREHRPMTTTARPHALSEDCWKILDCLRWSAWRAPAPRLNALGMLSYRGRISDLRLKHLVQIVAESHTDPETGRLHTVYSVPPESRPRAEHLWRFRSAEGFQPRPVQPSLFGSACAPRSP